MRARATITFRAQGLGEPELGGRDRSGMGWEKVLTLHYIARMKLRPFSPARYSAALRRRLRSPTSNTQPESGIGGGPRQAPPEIDGSEPSRSPPSYANLYEDHALALPPDSSIGDGDFDLIGRIELSILVDAGLKPSSYLFDFGCGTGRLAIHAVPYLSEGKYVGTDISPTMLRHATALLTKEFGATPLNVQFLTQPDETFPTVVAPDMICAYSVFTHMDHEDLYRYLRTAREASAPSTVLVASCLPMDLRVAREIFLASAAKPHDQRWAAVRNVVTSRDLFEAVATLAGWAVCSWLSGDAPATVLSDGTPAALGQSVVVMRPSLDHQEGDEPVDPPA